MIPDFQSIFLPYLKLLSDGKPHSTSDMEDQLAHSFQLSDEERKELLPSGKQARFRNRIAWTSAHLKQARLIEPISRGTYQITERGKSLLEENPAKLNEQFLLRYPEFQEWRAKASPQEDATTVPPHDERSTQSPDEIIEGTFKTINNVLAKELLEQIRASSPLFFEKVVIDLLLAMGYGGSREEAASLTKRSGDEGIDGIIKEDRLGLDTIYVQAKRWEAAVGRPQVQGFAGSLDGARARKGVMLTTSRFSAEAKEYVDRIEKKDRPDRRRTPRRPHDRTQRRCLTPPNLRDQKDRHRLFWGGVRMRLIPKALWTVLLLSFLGACTPTLETSVRAYFSEPGEDVESIIVDYVRTAKHQVLIQAYGFTSEAIYDVLDSLHRDGIDVRVILDRSNETAIRSKLKSLKKEHIQAMIDDQAAIAHDKIIIIDSMVVITGSYNWTEHSKKNVENIVVITDPTIAMQYVDNWNDREEVSRKPKKRK